MRFTYNSGSRPLDGFTLKRGVGRGGFGEVYFGVSDGANPSAGLTAVAGGTLYGASYSGGSPSCNPPFGCGTVFSLTSSGTGYKVLHRFAGDNAGKSPQAGLVFKNGTLYGAARTGGDNACELGCGAVYKVTP